MEELEFVENIRNELSAYTKTLSDKEVKEFIVKKVLCSGEFKDVSLNQVKNIVQRYVYAIRSDTSILKPYIDDVEVSEIMVNGYDEIFIEKKGNIKKLDESFLSEEELDEVVRRISSKVHKEVNELHPIVDARLEDGSRVNVVYKNIAVGKTTMTIRKFPHNNYSMQDFCKMGMLSLECMEWLQSLVNAGYNFFVSGGTSSGKTTFLNALAECIPKNERIVVIEDNTELRIRTIPNIVQMESRDNFDKDVKNIAMDDLIKTSLRMRPDRIILGEIRDGKALVNLLNALNTGHSGMCTGHGNSTRGMIKRMQALYMQEANFPIEAINNQIVEGINIIIHLKRLKNSKRIVQEISELTIDEFGNIQLNELFVYDGRELKNTGNGIINDEKLDICYGGNYE